MTTFATDARVLLTGATGFLGRHCLERLGLEGVEIHAVNRNGKGPALTDAQWHAADLRSPISAAATVEAVRPTHVLHSAWIVAPGRYWRHEDNLSWLEGSIALLRAFREIGGRRFVGVGSCAEYDWGAERFREDDTPCRPATLYGKSKYALWDAAQAFADNAFSAAWTRVFLPFGPGDNPARLIPSIISALRAGSMVALGTGEAVRDFVWAPDIADLLVRLLAGDATGVFNVGSGRGTAVGDVARTLAVRLGRPDLLQFGARSDPADEPASLVADMMKVERTLGWRASMSLEVGLDALLENG